MTSKYLFIVSCFLAGMHGTLCCAESLYDTLAGPLPGLIKATNKPYRVIADIEVLPDKTVTIEAGAVFLFQNFTGLHVRGKLIVQGTASKPVVFTSENDQQYNPSTRLIANPYDWNGIFIHSDGFGTYLENCIVAYTVYGIVSETKFIRMDPVFFKENGKSNLVIENEVKKDIVPEKPYSYVLAAKEATVEGVPIKIIKDPLARRRNISRSSGLTLALGGVVAGIAHGIQFSKARQEWEMYNNPNPSDVVSFQKTSQDRKKAHENYDRMSAFIIIDAGVAVAGVCFLAWSFTF